MKILTDPMILKTLEDSQTAGLIGFIISGSLLLFLVVFLGIVSFQMISTDGSSTWYWTESYITDKYTKTESTADTRTRIYHRIKVEGFANEILVTAEEYDKLAKNDFVYVLVQRDNALAIWSKEEYPYEGKHLKTMEQEKLSLKPWFSFFCGYNKYYLRGENNWKRTKIKL